MYAKYVESTIASETTGGVTWKLYDNGLLKLYPTNGVSGTMKSFEGYSSSPWYDYKTQIKSVKIEKGVKAGSKCSYMFYGCNIVTADVKELDTSNVTNMRNMFTFCQNLTSLDIGGWNVSNVTDMRLMLCNCSSLTSLEIGGWDTGNVTDMRDMCVFNASAALFSEFGFNLIFKLTL